MTCCRDGAIISHRQSVFFWTKLGQYQGNADEPCTVQTNKGMFKDKDQRRLAADALAYFVNEAGQQNYNVLFAT